MTHEFDGARYAHAAARQREWETRFIAALGLQGDERILDFGCGDGALTSGSPIELGDGHRLHRSSTTS